MKKKLLFLGLMLIATISLVACTGEKGKEKTSDIKKQEQTSTNNTQNNTDSISKIKEKGKLVLATSPDYPPYEFKTIKDGKLEIVGFEVEMAKKFAEKLGVDLEIKEMDFKLVIESVKKGEADIAMAGISPTPQRAEQVGMTEGYYKSEQTALIRAEDVDKYTSKDSLKGKNIGAQMGAIQVKIAQSVDGATVKELPLVTALLADLKTKKIDAIVMESAVAKQYAMGNPEFKVANFVFESDSESSVLAVKKDNTDLLEFLNKEIEQMISDGTVNKLVVDAMDITEAK